MTELDPLARETVRDGDQPRIRAILQSVCDRTGMGFAALARIAEGRWITCQVLDRIEFGLDPGDELALQTTICAEVQECGRAIVIDHVAAEVDWRTHPTPILYGFQSYVSIPVELTDGSFYGTLCAIDPAPHELSGAAVLAILTGYANEVGRLLSERR